MPLPKFVPRQMTDRERDSEIENREMAKNINTFSMTGDWEKSWKWFEELQGGPVPEVRDSEGKLSKARLFAWLDKTLANPPREGDSIPSWFEVQKAMFRAARLMKEELDREDNPNKPPPVFP